MGKVRTGVVSAPPGPRYLHKPILGPQPRPGRRRVGIHGADELARPGLLAVQVEAVAIGAFLQVAETWAQLLLSVQILIHGGQGGGDEARGLIDGFGVVLRQM